MSKKRITRSKTKAQLQIQEDEESSDSEEYNSVEEEHPEPTAKTHSSKLPGKSSGEQNSQEDSSSSTTQGTVIQQDTDQSELEGFATPTLTVSAEVKMAAGIVFNFDFFDENLESLERWLDRLEGAFKLFKLTDEDTHKNYLLHFIGRVNYNLVCDTLIPKKVADVTTAVIKEILLNYFSPKPVEIAEIYKFHHRMQMEGECIRDYIAVLRKMAVNCNFGEYLKTALRNQFVCGVRNKVIREKLLSTKDLKFDDAISTALNFEIMQEKSAEMSQPTNSVHRVDHFRGNKNRNQVNSNNNSKGAIPKSSSSQQKSSVMEKKM